MTAQTLAGIRTKACPSLYSLTFRRWSKCSLCNSHFRVGSWDRNGKLHEFLLLALSFLINLLDLHSIIEAGQSTSQLTTVKDIQFIEDSNDMHEFSIDAPHNEQSIRYLKITFHQSTDFYGRITIYSLKVFGTVVA